MRDSPSRWAQSPRLLAGTLLEMASLEAMDSPLVHFIPSKTLTSGSGTSDNLFHAEPCWPELQAQNSQAPGREGGGEEWLTGTALTLRERKTAGAERGQERTGSKVRVRVEAGG